MVTRTYYMPRNRIATHVLNSIVDKVGCSIGNIKISRKLDCIRVPITCPEKDVIKIERILQNYDMLG